NGAIQDEAQKLGVELPKEGRRFFSYGDGLYWSLITAASIGYGDITPQTTVGRVIAATLGILGVITIGVIAGLILNWISARSID
ncbi:MAG TPA: potassium channel family protein, partial [Roseiflexaceae bacterium]|nr:potassium channel family protein [Roseiflexaceae bacterium]